MDALVSSAPRTGLRPYAFMVAWDGVLALAYRGFPQPLVDLKSQLYRDFPELPSENPGSKWPKTTLGAVADAAVRITLDQLRELKRVCTACNLELQKHFREDDEEAIIPVDALAVVMYCCTSTEKRLLVHSMNLNPASDRDVTVRPGEMQRVNDVLSEFADDALEGYLDRVATGRNTASNYRSPRVGSTLVIELPAHPALLAALQSFRAKVDAVLGGGFYTWFEPTALHVTVRGL